MYSVPFGWPFLDLSFGQHIFGLVSMATTGCRVNSPPRDHNSHKLHNSCRVLSAVDAFKYPSKTKGQTGPTPIPHPSSLVVICFSFSLSLSQSPLPVSSDVCLAMILGLIQFNFDQASQFQVACAKGQHNIRYVYIYKYVCDYL